MWCHFEPSTWALGQGHRLRILYKSFVLNVVQFQYFAKPSMDFIHLWHDDRALSKILRNTIPIPVHDLKVKVIDFELFCVQFLQCQFCKAYDWFELCLVWMGKEQFQASCHVWRRILLMHDVMILSDATSYDKKNLINKQNSPFSIAHCNKQTVLYWDLFIYLLPPQEMQIYSEICVESSFSPLQHIFPLSR